MVVEPVVVVKDEPDAETTSVSAEVVMALDEPEPEPEPEAVLLFAPPPIPVALHGEYGQPESAGVDERGWGGEKLTSPSTMPNRCPMRPTTRRRRRRCRRCRCSSWSRRR